MKTMNIISIAPDKQVSIVVGGAFYQRINKLLIEYSDMIGKERLLLALKKIEANVTDKDDIAFNLETLMILTRDIEKEFHNAGYTVDNEINIDDLPEDFKSKV